MTQLICPDCQRDNEPERIFCHGCGARLDRTILVAEKSDRERPDEAHQRLKRLLDPERGKLRRLFFKFCKIMLTAAVVAVVIELFLPQDVVAPVKRVGAPREINFELEKAMVSPQPVQLLYTQEQVNAYLAYALKTKHTALDHSPLTFKQVVVDFADGNTCTMTIERSLFGYSVFQRAAYQVNVNGGKISASGKGVWFGRLPIAPQLMKFGDIAFADLWSALDRERKLVAKMGAIEIHQGAVDLTSPAK